jgi:hypothetical protein
MTLPKNRLTTNPVARVARQQYRDHLRPLAQDGFVRARLRVLSKSGHRPDFLIVGAQKAGTTGLFDSLIQRPSFGEPLLKEIHYFDNFPTRPPEWYFAHFWGRDGLVWGESSPEYLDTPGVADAVHALLPLVKIVITLRDPVKRAVSHYYHALDFGYEDRPIEVAMREELQQLRTGTRLEGRARDQRGYITRSRYAESVSPWMDIFPSDQVLVVVAERRRQALRETLQFLGQPDDMGDQQPASSNTREYPAPTPEVTRMISEGVADDIVRLCDLLDWQAPPSEWTT